MTGRRLAAVVLAAMLLTPAVAANAESHRLYLRGAGVPVSVLSESAPTSSSVGDFDWLRNDDPGLTLRPGGSWQTSSSTRFQEFVWEASGLAVSGGSSVSLWSAMEDFDDEGTGSIEVFLLDCNRLGGSCELLSSASVTEAAWSASGDWSERSFSLPAVEHTFGEDRVLKLRVVVGPAATDDMWIAYDSAATPSSLAVDLGAPTTTTTTRPPPTTTTTGVTTTTTPAPTTTTRPTTTTTTPGDTTTTTSRPATSDTTSPGETTTSTASTTTTTAPAGDDEVGEEEVAEDTTTTTAPPPGDPGPGTPQPPSPVEIDRARLAYDGAGDVSFEALAVPVRTRIGPLERLSVTFTTAVESLQTTLVPALLLGGFGALLVISLFEQSRGDLIRRSVTLLEKLPPRFRPLWTAIRSRMAGS